MTLSTPGAKCLWTKDGLGAIRSRLRVAFAVPYWKAGSQDSSPVFVAVPENYVSMAYHCAPFLRSYDLKWKHFSSGNKISMRKAGRGGHGLSRSVQSALRGASRVYMDSSQR